MRPARREELRSLARKYVGELVRQVVNTYTAFEDLPEEEHVFVDKYIREFGERVLTGGRG